MLPIFVSGPFVVTPTRTMHSRRADIALAVQELSEAEVDVRCPVAPLGDPDLWTADDHADFRLTWTRRMRGCAGILLLRDWDTCDIARLQAKHFECEYYNRRGGYFLFTVKTAISVSRGWVALTDVVGNKHVQ